MKRFFLAFAFLLALCGATFAEDGYVRLAIKGTNVNLRPQPRAAGSVVAQMNTGDVFFAEKWPITCDSDGSQWYKIVLPASDSGAIKALRDWNSRFKANVAFAHANFVTISPLKKGDMDRILATPVGKGYSFNVDPDTGEFNAMVEAGFIPFSPVCSIIKKTDIFGDNPFNTEGPVIGRHEQGTDVRIVGMESEGVYYVAADPNFLKPVGFVEAGDISVERYELELGDFDFVGFQTSCVLSVGANLPEIVRKWGSAKIERNAFEFLDEYVIHTSIEQPDFQVTFYEMPPKPDGTPTDSPAITYLQTFSTERKGALIGGIHVGHDDKNSIQKLLGEPGTKDKDEAGEFWNWHAEFSDLYVHFDGNGRVSKVYIEARAAD